LDKVILGIILIIALNTVLIPIQNVYSIPSTIENATIMASDDATSNLFGHSISIGDDLL